MTIAAADRNDQELVARLLRGEEAALTTLFDQHHAALRCTAPAFVSTDLTGGSGPALVRRPIFEAAILGLPAPQRTVVMLRDALGFPPEDVRNALAVNASNQRVLLHRARLRLRASLLHHTAPS